MHADVLADEDTPHVSLQDVQRQLEVGRIGNGQDRRTRGDYLAFMRQSLLDHAAERRAQLEPGHLGLDELLRGRVNGVLLELHIQHRIGNSSDHLALHHPRTLVDQ